MLTTEQANARKIGGSSAATVMGLSKYRTRYEQWQLDTGQIEKEDISDKIDIIVGNKLEEPLRCVMVSRGVNVLLDKDLLIHPDFEWYTGYIDGYRDDTVVEFKTSINWRMDKDFGDNGTDEIPLEYNYQLQHYLLHPRFNHAELHVVFMPIEVKQIIADIDFTMDELISIVERLPIRTYYIEPDLLLQDKYIEEAEYYRKCVLDRTPPRLINAKEAEQAYLNSNGKAVPLGDEELRILSEMDAAKKEKKSIEKQINVCKDKLSVFFGENEVGTYNGKKVCSYKTQESRRVDTQKLKDDNLYDKYLKVSQSRVLRT